MLPQNHGCGEWCDGEEESLVDTIRMHREMIAYIDKCRKHTMTPEETEKFWSDQRYYCGRRKPRKR